MTDSKTPEWAREAARAFHDKWETGMSGAAFRDFAQALLSAYERGRKEGIEGAAKVVEAHQATPRLFPYGGTPTENEAAEAGQEFAADEIATAIRQLLEVKSEDGVEKT